MTLCSSSRCKTWNSVFFCFLFFCCSLLRTAQFSNYCRKELWNCDCYALGLVIYQAPVSANEKQNQNQPLPVPPPPSPSALSKLQVIARNSGCLLLLWLTGVISLVLVLPLSFKNHPICWRLGIFSQYTFYDWPLPEKNRTKQKQKNKNSEQACKHSVGLENIFGNIQESLVFMFWLYAFQFRDVAAIQGYACNRKRKEIK